MKLDNVFIWNGVEQANQIFTAWADIQVHQVWTGPTWADIDGWNNKAAVKIGISQPANPRHPFWWASLVHELGHYFLGLADEYYDGARDEAGFRTYRNLHPDESQAIMV